MPHGGLYQLQKSPEDGMRRLRASSLGAQPGQVRVLGAPQVTGNHHAGLGGVPVGSSTTPGSRSHQRSVWQHIRGIGHQMAWGQNTQRLLTPAPKAGENRVHAARIKKACGATGKIAASCPCGTIRKLCQAGAVGGPARRKVRVDRNGGACGGLVWSCGGSAMEIKGGKGGPQRLGDHGKRGGPRGGS